MVGYYYTGACQGELMDATGIGGLGVCNGISLDYTLQKMLAHRYKTPINYAWNFNGIAVCPVLSHHYMTRMAEYQELQAAQMSGVSVKSIKEKNIYNADYIKGLFEKTSFIGLSMSNYNGYGKGHIVALNAYKNDKGEITGYGIYDSNYGEFTVSDPKKSLDEKTEILIDILKQYIVGHYKKGDFISLDICDLEAAVKKIGIYKEDEYGVPLNRKEVFQFIKEFIFSEAFFKMTGIAIGVALAGFALGALCGFPSLGIMAVGMASAAVGLAIAMYSNEGIRVSVKQHIEYGAYRFEKALDSMKPKEAARAA